MKWWEYHLTFFAGYGAIRLLSALNDQMFWSWSWWICLGLGTLCLTVFISMLE